MTNGAFNNQFVAIDFETANADLSSICQVGVVEFNAGGIIDSWGALVNPQDEFDWINISIHGIKEDDVQGAPVFPEIYETLRSMLSSKVVVSHTSFDRTALSQALVRHELPAIDCTWLDSARVVRRVWSQWAQKGYGLGSVCKELGIDFDAHDALEDARAAGEVLNRAIEESNLDIDGLLARVNKPIDLTAMPSYNSNVKLEGNQDGPLFGEKLVFTGALNLSRREAAKLAADVGCDVDSGVTKHTTLLVVGDQDIKKLAGHEKSSKHRKAEELIKKGRPIRILRETDFLEMVHLR